MTLTSSPYSTTSAPKAISTVSDILFAVSTAGVKAGVTAPFASFLLVAVIPKTYKTLLMISFRFATMEFAFDVDAKSLEVNPLEARTGGEPCSMIVRHANCAVSNVRTIALSDGLIERAFPRTSSFFAATASEDEARAPQIANCPYALTTVHNSRAATSVESTSL